MELGACVRECSLCFPCLGCGASFASPSLPQVTVQCGIPGITTSQVSVLVWAARARGSIRWGALGSIAANRVSIPVSMESAAGSKSHGAIQCLT